MRALAEVMRDAIAVSIAQGDSWHLPYIRPDELRAAWSCGLDFSHLAMISAARCARVSYLKHDGSTPDAQEDLALAERLRASRHMSPFEHQARVTGEDGTLLWGNFTGWNQHRKMLESQP